MKKLTSVILIMCMFIMVLPIMNMYATENILVKEHINLDEVNISVEYDNSIHYSEIMNTNNWKALCYILDRWSGDYDDFNNQFELAYEFVMQQLCFSQENFVETDPKGILSYAFYLDAETVDNILRTNFSLSDAFINRLHFETYQNQYGVVGYYHNQRYYLNFPEGTQQGSLYSIKLKENKYNLYEAVFINQDFSGYGMDNPSYRRVYNCIFEVRDDGNGQYFKIHKIDAPRDNRFCNHTYQFITEKMTWEDAKKYCESQGGHLVTITSLEENTYVLGLSMSDEHFWIGATHERESGFSWVTGENAPFLEPLEYGEPSTAAKYIVASPYGWTNIMNRELSFVCEWDYENIDVDYLTKYYWYDTNGGTSHTKYRFNKDGTYVKFLAQYNRYIEGEYFLENNYLTIDDLEYSYLSDKGYFWNDYWGYKLTNTYEEVPGDGMISVLVSNGENSFVKFDQPPIMQNDRVLVPIRAIFEELGYTLEWDGESKTAVAVNGDKKITVTEGDANIYHNDGVYVCNVAPVNISGRLLVPVRAIGETAGCEVFWIESAKTVYIEKPYIPTIVPEGAPATASPKATASPSN